MTPPAVIPGPAFFGALPKQVQDTVRAHSVMTGHNAWECDVDHLEVTIQCKVCVWKVVLTVG